MNELVKLVAEKTGIAEDKARIAVETVVSHLKTKLPSGIASQLDTAVGTGTAAGLGDAAKAMGGLGR